MKGIIYKFTSPSGKVYIGQTITKHRKQQHLKCAKNGRKTKFYDAVRKYGFDNFKYEVLVTICFEDKCELKQILNWLERYFIWKYNSCGENGYNLTEGGDGRTGVKMSEEAKQKISYALKGRKGFPLTEEIKQKISEAKKGIKQSEEAKKKISYSLKGIKRGPMSDETKQKLSEAKKGRIPWNKGKVGIYSDETRQRISESVKNTMNIKKQTA